MAPNELQRVIGAIPANFREPAKPDPGLHCRALSSESVRRKGTVHGLATEASNKLRQITSRDCPTQVVWRVVPKQSLEL